MPASAVTTIDRRLVDRVRATGLFDSFTRLSDAELHETLHDLGGGPELEAAFGIPGHQVARKDPSHWDWHNDAHWDHDLPRHPRHTDFQDHYNHNDQDRSHLDGYADSRHLDHNDHGHVDSHGDHHDGPKHTDTRAPHTDTGNHVDSHTNHGDAENFPPYGDYSDAIRHTDAHYDSHCDEHFNHGDHADEGPPPHDDIT